MGIEAINVESIALKSTAVELIGVALIAQKSACWYPPCEKTIRNRALSRSLSAGR